MEMQFSTRHGLRKKIWQPVLFRGCPSWQRAIKTVTIDQDLQQLSFTELDYLFAIFASNGFTDFRVRCSGDKLDRWMASVERRSVGAAAKYEARMRAHFRRYKKAFREGYSLPEPPTPQLRVIYDSAAREERRPRNPCGTTLHSGFSGSEYHWRAWPLNNVTVTG